MTAPVFAVDSGADENLIQYLARPDPQSICECSYYKRHARGGHRGEMVFNRSCDADESLDAIMMIDGQRTILQRSDPDYNGEWCMQGAAHVEAWKAPGVSVELQLRVVGPGKEACHSEGTLKVTKDGKSEAMEIVAECGI